MDSANAADCYHIIVLDSGIKADSLRGIEDVIKCKENFSLRIENIEPWLEKHRQSFKETAYLTKAMYGRLLIPEICAKYKKAIYAEADCVFNRDIAELFSLDLGQNYIAAVPDVLSETERVMESWREKYISAVLKLSKDDSYVFSGFLIFNIPEWRKNRLADKCIDFLRENQTMFPDQDAINAVCRGRIAYLPQIWCVTVLKSSLEWRFSRISRDKYPRQNALLREWQSAYNAPSESVIHYNGPDKPWMPHSDNPLDGYWRALAHLPIHEPVIRKMREISQNRKNIGGGRETVSIYKFLGIPLLKIKAKRGVEKYLAFGSVRIAKIAHHPDRTEISILGSLSFTKRQKGEAR